MSALLLLLLACRDEPGLGVYRSGPNAVARGARSEEVLVWGTAGTLRRIPSKSDGNVLLGESGPLWIVDRELPAPPKATPVSAAMVERAGFRMKDLLAPAPPDGAAADPAKQRGVYVRSVVKVRRPGGPPLYVVSATGDEVGAGKFGGPPDVRKGENCKAALGLLDDKGEKLLASVWLDAATRTCAVPVVVPPIDRDGDGMLDVLVHGQHEKKGFRSWFRIDGGKLVPGPEDVWEAIP